MATIEAKTCTPDDLLVMPDGDRFELVEGRVVERKVGGLSSWVEGRLFAELERFCNAHNLGWVWPSSNGYQCFPGSPAQVRRPDVSFIRRGRLPGERIPPGFITLAPDLVVEVISPNDLAHEVNEKVLDYLEAGVELIWVVDPEAKTIFIHRGHAPGGWLRAHDELDGENVIPGFRIPVATIFPPPAPTA